MPIAKAICAAVAQGSQEAMPWRFGIRSGAGENAGICETFKYCSGHPGPSIAKQHAISANPAMAPAISVLQRF